MSFPRENAHSFMRGMVGVTRRQQERQCTSSKDALQQVVVKMKEAMSGLSGLSGYIWLLEYSS
jgi:hypothetical protein